MRYYSFAGHVIGETTPSTLYWLTGSTQGTMTTAVTAFSESSPPVRRAMTPYGTPLAGGGTWPDDRGFLGDPAHTATGLTDVGARKFDPATGLFLSVDPVLATANPQDMTGYTYAAGDPITSSDPTGEVQDYAGGGGGGGGCPYGTYGCPGYNAPDIHATDTTPTMMGTTPGVDPTAPYISAYHPPVIRPKPKPAAPPFNSSECLRFGLECSYQGFEQMAKKVMASAGGEHMPDYYTVGFQVCGGICVGLSFSVDRYNRTYVNVSGGLGLGASVGMTETSIDDLSPKYHTPGYIHNFITG